MRLYMVLDRRYGGHAIARGLSSRSAADQTLIAFVARGYTDLEISYEDVDDDVDDEETT